MFSYPPARPRVIVGVDGSAASRTAIEWATRYAVRTGRILTACTVVPDTTAAPDAARAEDVVAQARATAHSCTPAVLTHGLVAVGQPADELHRRTTDNDILVVGQHGAGWLGRLGLGSVAMQLAAHASCPVVVTRPGPAPRHRPVVVGADGPAWTQPALEFAFDLAARDELRVIGVTAYPAPDDAPERDRERAVGQLESALRPWMQKYPDVAVHREVIGGGASRALVESSRRASLIVLGRRGRGGFPALRLGSVSQHVLTLADCPVTVLP